MYQILAGGRQTTAEKGRDQCHMTNFQLLGMTDYPLMDVVMGTWPVFLNIAPSHTFGVCETRHLKCNVLIDRDVY